MTEVAGFHWPRVDKAPVSTPEVELEKARQAGYEKGLAEGRAAAAAEVRQRLSSLDAAVSEVRAAGDRLSERWLNAMLEMLQETLSGLLWQQLTVDESRLKLFLERAAAVLDTRGALQVSVHPDHAALFNELEHVEVTPDADLQTEQILVTVEDRALLFRPRALVAELMADLTVRDDA